MIGGIIAIVIAFWFYRIAEARGLPNFQWAAAGAIAYYVPNFVWKLAVVKPWLNSLHMTGATFTTGLINFSSVFVGLVCAFLVYKFLLPKTATAARS